MIYLDYNATTPVDEEVCERMWPFFSSQFGNPSSSYRYGQTAKEAVDYARRQIASLIGCTAEEIIFTSSGSESNNLAIQGTALALEAKGKHLITTTTEHPAVLNTCRFLEKRFGFEVTYLPVGSDGRVTAYDVEKSIRPDTVLITIMTANNETGVIQPIREIGATAQKHRVCFHTDAAQAVGKVPIHVGELGVDLLTIVGHKIYAPKGISALYVKQGTNLQSLIQGAGHERNLRAGTENVPYIVALGQACEVAERHLTEGVLRMAMLSDRLYKRLESKVNGIVMNGSVEHRLPNTLNISIPGLFGQDLLDRIPNLAASTGSACHAGDPSPSPVLTAMGVERKQALGALRLSVGRYTTEEEVDRAADLLADEISRMTASSR